MSVAEKVRVFRTGDEVEVRALADHLEQQGIDVFFMGGELTGGPYGLYGADPSPNLELWTNESDAEAAGALIDAWNREHHPNRKELEARPIRYSPALETRPIRYSLRSLLFLMTVVALAAAICAASGVDGVAFVLGICELGLILFCASRLRWRRVDSDEQRGESSPLESRASVEGDTLDP